MCCVMDHGKIDLIQADPDATFYCHNVLTCKKKKPVTY